MAQQRSAPAAFESAVQRLEITLASAAKLKLVARRGASHLRLGRSTV